MRSTDRRLLRSAGIAAAAIAAAVGLGVASAGLAVAEAWLLATTIAGAFLGGRELGTLIGPLAALAIVLAARAGLAWAGEGIAQRISSTVKSDLRRRVLARALELGPRWASGARSGELVLLVTRGLDALDGYFGRYLPQLGLAVVVPVVVVACLFAADLVAALTVLLTVPLIPVFMILVGQASEARRRRRWTALARLGHRFLDVVTGLPTLRAYGRATSQVAALARTTDAYRRETMSTLRVAFLSALVLELLATLSVALVAVGIGLRLVEGDLTLETGLFVLVLAPEAYLPLRRLGAEFHASEEGLAAAAAAFAILDTEPLPSGVRTEIPDPLTALEVDGLSVFAPGRDALAPWQATLTVRPGEVVAVTGPSGAGKSTLLLAILAMVSPTEGHIRVVGGDGSRIALEELAVDAWRSQVAWVPQAPFLVAGTVAQNVRLGAPEATSAELAVTLAAVGLADLEPDRMLGERGAGLSSGQRRRLGVARALLRRSPILLLDEPTAGLDEATEAAVLAAIRAEADRGAAVLLVAHRPAAARAADRTVAVDWRATTPTADGGEPAGGRHSTPAPPAVAAP